MTQNGAGPESAATDCEARTIGGTSERHTRFKPSTRKPQARRRRQRPEASIQRAVLDHLAWRGVPFLFAFHCPNGGWRTPVEAKIFRSLGVIAGIPDLLIVHRGQLFGLELKADKNGCVGETQATCHKRLRDAGARVAVAVGIDEAVKQLEAWSLLRGQVVTGRDLDTHHA
jgi:hypothetical protein